MDLIDALNISVDDNDADTSHDELDEDPEFHEIFLTQGVQKTHINREVISSDAFPSLFKEWERPQFEEGTILYSSSPFVAQPEPFQFLFLDSVSSVSSIKHREVKLEEEVKDAPLHTVMRLFGVARVPEGGDEFEDSCSYSDTSTFSVCCNVHGYLPHFYALPTLPILPFSCDFRKVKAELEKRLNEDVHREILKDATLVDVHSFLDCSTPVVARVEGVKLKDVENSIFHFPGCRDRSKDSVVLKINVTLPMFVSATARVLNTLKLNLRKGGQPCEFEIFEKSLTNNIRFLTDQNVPGCTWLELKPGKYFKRNVDSSELDCESHCQIELDVHYRDISALSAQQDDIPPLRILSIDLESRVSSINSDPSVEASRCTNQVIQIGAVLSAYSRHGKPVIGKTAFVLGPCAALPDAKVVQFYDKDNPDNNTEENLIECEALMLASFRDFVIQIDPDIITGYNVKNFDIPYLIERSEKYMHQFEELKRFPFLGRLKKVKTSIRPILNEHKKLYNFDKYLVNIQGRIIMDMFPLFQRHQVERGSLKLKHVAKRYLSKGEDKDDVKYTEINTLHEGDRLTRKRLAKYCVQDSYLPVKLMQVHMPDRKSEEINFMEYYFETSHLSGTILRYLVNKSKEYNMYFKQVRFQKNNGKVKYYPDSPPKKQSPVKNGHTSTSPVKNQPGPSRKQKYCSKMLFTDDE